MEQSFAAPPPLEQYFASPGGYRPSGPIRSLSLLKPLQEHCSLTNLPLQPNILKGSSHLAGPLFRQSVFGPSAAKSCWEGLFEKKLEGFAMDAQVTTKHMSLKQPHMLIFGCAMLTFASDL